MFNSRYKQCSCSNDEGLIALIKLLLSKGFKYVLPGTFQSDRLEGEFGVYRQSAGGCYYISLQQIMNSLSLQRLKLFDKLEIESKSAHVTEDCCSESLNNEEVEMLDECFDLASTLTEVEKSSLYYIAGYVAAKENLSVSDESDNQHPNSEFTTLLSRGKLSHLPVKPFDLTCVLYTYYKKVTKSCIQHLLIAFQQIYESRHLEYEAENRILRGLINCFSKAFSKQQCDSIRAKTEQANAIKRRRVHYE